MRNSKGFTLVELLVAMTIATVVMSGVYSAYYSQQRSYQVQEQVAGMQQNLRAAMAIMEREIRMAGCDPTGNADAGITAATATSITFTKDTADDDGDTDGDDCDSDGTTDEADEKNCADGFLDDVNENITYTLYDSSLDSDSDLDDLGRDTGGGNQPVAENIGGLNFSYILEDGTITSAPTADQLAEIRAVDITLLARTARTDPGFNKQRTLTCRVHCRNMGL